MKCVVQKAIQSVDLGAVQAFISNASVLKLLSHTGPPRRLVECATPCAEVERSSDGSYTVVYKKKAFLGMIPTPVIRGVVETFRRAPGDVGTKGEGLAANQCSSLKKPRSALECHDSAINGQRGA